MKFKVGDLVKTNYEKKELGIILPNDLNVQFKDNKIVFYKVFFFDYIHYLLEERLELVNDKNH